MIKIAKNEKQKVEKLYDIIKECESNPIDRRDESVKNLKDISLMYSQIQTEKGTNYCSKNFPDIPGRINNLINKIFEYNT